MKTFRMKIQHFCILIILVFGVDLFGQEGIVWENRDMLNCDIISYDKDSITFKLPDNDELKTISTKDIKYIYIVGKNNRRKRVEYIIEKDRTTILIPGTTKSYQQSIVWENRDMLNCDIISYDKDSIVFKLPINNELQTISTKDIKYIYAVGKNNKLTEVQYLNEKDRPTYSNTRNKNSYVFPAKNKIKSGIQNQLSTNFGFQIEQEGGMNTSPHLKYSIWKLGRKKLGFGGSLSYINYSPSEKKIFLTPSLGVYFIPNKKTTTNFMAEIGYGYSSSRMVNFLDKDFRTNVLKSKGGLYSGFWMEKQLFGLNKSAINLTTGFTYQRGTFEVEVLEDVFIYKSQTIDFLRFWVGTGIRF